MEDEILVRIKAVDEMSDTLKKIEGKVGQSNESLKSSFSKVQGAMLNLGQAAQGLHNIFEISEGVTRRLENAQDRLENATLRVKNATEDLRASEQKASEIEKKHANDALTLERAQLDVESATRRLNNITQEANRYRKEMSDGTKYQGELSDRVAATFENEKDAILSLKESQVNLNNAQDLGNQKAQELTEANQQVMDRQDALTIANNNAERANRALEKAVSDVKWSYLDMGMQALSTAGNIGVFINTLSGEGGAIASAKGMTTVLGAAGGAGVVGTGLAGAFAVLAGILLYDHAKSVQEAAIAYDRLGDSADRNAPKFRDLSDSMDRLGGSVGSRGTRITTEATIIGPETRAGADNAIDNYLNSRKVGDAIIRPNGEVIETDPKDTLIALKDTDSLGGGITVYVTGNTIYGTDPDDIAIAITDKLRRKISL